MGRGLDGFFDPRSGYCAVLKDRGRARGLSPFSGGFGEGETPLPIPNRAVKPLSADGTWLARARESRTPPVFYSPRGRPSTGRPPAVTCPLGDPRAHPLVAPARADGGEARLDRGPGFTRTPRPFGPLQLSPVQRRSRRLRLIRGALPVDLPVDATVVLEQQERADQIGGGERALRQR